MRWREQLLGGAREFGVAGQRGFAQRGGRCVQQAVDQRVRDPNEVLDLLAHTLVNRLLHAPTAALREAALTGDGELARAADKLFPPLPSNDATQVDGDNSENESDSGDANA